MSTRDDFNYWYDIYGEDYSMYPEEIQPYIRENIAVPNEPFYSGGSSEAPEWGPAVADPDTAFTSPSSTTTTQPYYSEEGTLYVWTGDGYHPIPRIAASDVGIVRPGEEIWNQGDTNYTLIGKTPDAYGILDPAKYGLPDHFNNFSLTDGTQDAFNYLLKSDDKVGTQIGYTLDGDWYIPTIDGAMGWDTNQSKQNRALLSVAAAPLLSYAGQALTGVQGVAPTFGTYGPAIDSALAAGVGGASATAPMTTWGIIDTSAALPGTTFIDAVSGLPYGMTGELYGPPELPEPFESNFPSSTPYEPYGPPSDLDPNFMGPPAGLEGVPPAVPSPPGELYGPPSDLDPNFMGPPAGGAGPVVPGTVPSIPGSPIKDILDWAVKNPQLAAGIIGAGGSLVEELLGDDDPAAGGGGGGGGGWNGPIQQLQAVQTRQAAPAGYRPGFSPEHVYVQTSYQGGAPTQPAQMVVAPPPDIPPLPPRRFAEGGSVMATDDVAARIAALQNLQPYTGSQITWPKLWGNMPVMGQTPEGYAVTRQPGGDIMLADPNRMVGTTNDLMDMRSYLTTGGESGRWDPSAPTSNRTDPRLSGQALNSYMVGVDALGQPMYDFGDGKVVSANGNVQFNADNGGSIAPVAPNSARRADGGWDSQKLRELGYQEMSFGPNGMQPYDPMRSVGGDTSVGWVRNVGGTMYDPDGRVLNPGNAPTAGSGGAWGQTAPEGFAYAGTPPPGADPATWANDGTPWGTLNRSAGSAWNYQPPARTGVAALPAAQNSIAASQPSYMQQPRVQAPQQQASQQPATAVPQSASGIANLPAAQTEAYRGLWSAPSSVQALMDQMRQNVRRFAKGGFIQGPGTGTSDSIPAVIDGDPSKPARLSTNEFVLPEWFVEALGNGSAQAGAQRLYALMDQVKSRRSDPGAAMTQMT